MHDAATACTFVDRVVRTASRRPFHFKPAIKMARAHLMLQRRPSFAAAAAELLAKCRTSLSEQLGAPFSLTGEVAPSWLNPFDGLSRLAAFAVIELGALGVNAVLEIDALTLGSLLSRVAGSQKRMALPISLTRLEEAAFGWLLLLAIEAARGQPQLEQRFCPRLVSIHTQRSEVLDKLDCRQRHLAFNARTDLDGQRGAMRLIIPCSAIERACHEVDQSLPSTFDPTIGAATIAGRVLAGRAILSPGEVEGLVPGDVVIFDGAKLEAGVLTGPARVATRTFTLHGSLSGAGFTFTQETAMSTHKSAIEVEIELTRLQLPVAELATLKPGAVLPLHINGAQPVMLRIGERIVAKAELVDIDGELGARIIAMSK
jgi:type III secretion protein Q